MIFSWYTLKSNLSVRLTAACRPPPTCLEMKKTNIPLKKRTSSSCLGGTAVAGVTRIPADVRIRLADRIDSAFGAISETWVRGILGMAGTSYHNQPVVGVDDPSDAVLSDFPLSLSMSRENSATSNPERAISNRVRENNRLLLHAYVQFLRDGNGARLKSIIYHLATVRTAQGVGGAELIAALFHFRPSVVEVLGSDSVSPTEQVAMDLVTQRAVTEVASAAAKIKAAIDVLPESVFPPAEIFVLRDEDGKFWTKITIRKKSPLTLNQ